MLKPAPPPPSWWRHIPAAEQQKRLREIRRLRLKAWFTRRGNQMKAALAVYLLICLVPLFIGLPLLSAFAAMPLLLLPAVGYLSYWLIWQEFHR
jgi:uncharacterized BrkB/YihY/UPF0761 family membrane protein